MEVKMHNEKNTFEMYRVLMIQFHFSLIFPITVILFVFSFYIDFVLVFMILLVLAGALSIVLADILSFYLTYGYSPLGIEYEEKDGIIVKKK